MGRVPEREAAKAAGERFYFTGIPCRNGHVVKRYTATGICSRCAVINTLRSQAKAPEHPNRIAARVAGITHYSTGIPCKHGHDLRFVSNGICVECDAVRNRRWHSSRPGLEARWARQRRAKDPTGHRAASRKWREANLDRAKTMLARWRRNNPERWKEIARATQNRRRTRKAANGGSFTADNVAALLAKQDGCCAGCGRQTARLEIDHILPIKLGGSSDPHNLQLLCSPCNKSKGVKHPDEWRRSFVR